MVQPPEVIFVAGPTCSGKSALALLLAERLDGVVINADSMQLYAELRVLTARPSPEEEARVPHRLYGVLPAARAASVAWWREQALATIRETLGRGRVPILTGGTGLYFHALTKKLSELPPVSEAAREEARSLLAAEGAAALHARLQVLDAETAASLRPSDAQRIARAYEVVRGTGRGLRAWQKDAPALPPMPWAHRAIQLDPPRAALRQALAARFAAMMQQGALQEVAALATQKLDPALPAMRAHGVPELLAVLAGQMDTAAAIQRAVLNTGQYVKRQGTWFRHHPLAEADHLHIIHARISGLAQLSESERRKIFSFIESRR